MDESFYEVFTDGGCSPNPGVGGISVVIRARGKGVYEQGCSIGSSTSNLAEYAALRHGLEVLAARK